VSRRLTVRIGHDSLHAVEAPERFEATGDFAVAVDNDGRAVHVHLAPDDALASAVSIPESNHLVDGDGSLKVPIRVATDRRVEGELEVVAAYGAESRAVEVAVGPEQTETTTVDPNRAAIRSESARSGLRDRFAAVTGDSGAIPPGLVALTALAALAAFVAALVVGGTAAVVGVLVLLLGVVVAGGLLLVDT
jgi:hypothetical protein